MPRKKLLLVFPALFFICQACIVPHKSFVASSFEPVTVKKKGDMELSTAIRPFKFYKINTTMAVSDKLAVRVGYSGFPQLNMADASCIFYKNFKTLGIFIAPGYNYQHNSIKRNYSYSFFGIGREFHYECEYHSPSLAIGLSLFTRRNNLHQLIIKGSYNIVSRYNYYFTSNTASGRDSGFYVEDEETMNSKIANFFSIEPSYSLVTGINRHLSFRFQLGFNLWQTVLRHNYSFNTKAYGGPQTKDATNLHPVSMPVNVSVGFIFRHSIKKKPIAE